MPDINGIPYVESSDLVSAYPAASQALAQEVSDQLASKLPYSFGTATPSTTDSGFLWYDSNSTPAAPKFWDGSAFIDFPSGLSLIASETLTTASSVNVNGCFTSAYENYQIVFAGVASTAGQELRWRARNAGSDVTTTDYDIMGILVTGSVNVRNSAALDYVTLCGLGQRHMLITMKVFRPAVATQTGYDVFSSVHAPGVYRQTLVAGGGRNTSASHDGFTIYTSGGTVTGTLRVYGWKD